MSRGLTVIKLEVTPWFFAVFAIFGHASGGGDFWVFPSAVRIKQNAVTKTHY